jgi:hypothetical protein
MTNRLQQLTATTEKKVQEFFEISFLCCSFWHAIKTHQDLFFVFSRLVWLLDAKDIKKCSFIKFKILSLGRRNHRDASDDRAAAKAVHSSGPNAGTHAEHEHGCAGEQRERQRLIKDAQRQSDQVHFEWSARKSLVAAAKTVTPPTTAAAAEWQHAAPAQHRLDVLSQLEWLKRLRSGEEEEEGMGE